MMLLVPSYWSAVIRMPVHFFALYAHMLKERNGERQRFNKTTEFARDKQKKSPSSRGRFE